MERLKLVWKYGSTILLVGIIAILLVPSWRVQFQGWFQSVFMGELIFTETDNTALPSNVLNWEITDLKNQTYSLGTLTNQPIVISFWATWCPPCRAELKELKALKASLHDGVTFISVTEESAKKVQNSGLNETYDFLYTTKRFPTFFEITSYPTLAILNTNQEIIFKHAGAGGISNEKNRAFMEGLIQNQ